MLLGKLVHHFIRRIRDELQQRNDFFRETELFEIRIGQGRFARNIVRGIHYFVFAKVVKVEQGVIETVDGYEEIGTVVECMRSCLFNDQQRRFCMHLLLCLHSFQVVVATCHGRV